MHIAVCALTFRRNEGIHALLHSLAEIELPGEGITVEVVVVDNDEEGSAEPVVATARESLPWPVRYEIEPRRGIPFGRNRAVAAAPDADLIVFIDDDEVPEPGWLRELVRVQQATGADVVTGQVVPAFPEPPPRWALRGRFFERPRYATGTAIDYARTANVLVRAPLLRDPWPPFAEWLGLTGADDTHFFMRVHLAGARIVWADEAIVVESIPGSRVSARWLVRRAYRRGNTLSLCLRDLADTWPRRAKRLAAVLWHVTAGVAQLPTALVRGKAGWVAAAQRVAHGVGLLTGLLGSQYEEYRTIHGS